MPRKSTWVHGNIETSECNGIGMLRLMRCDLVTIRLTNDKNQQNYKPNEVILRYIVARLQNTNHVESKAQ